MARFGRFPRGPAIRGARWQAFRAWSRNRSEGGSREAKLPGTRWAFMAPRIFSGVQPTGGLHVGNWLGALKNWVDLLDTGRYEGFFSVVDTHAVTVDYDPKDMPG